MSIIETIWGLVLLVVAGGVWLDQVVCALAPRIGARWGLAEPRESVDAVIWTDNRAEAIWDTLALWVLPLAGVLLLFNHPRWPPVALVGSGMYLYFAGRALVQRRLMQRHGVRVGTPGYVRLVQGVMALCAVLAAVTIALAVTAPG